MNFLNGLLLSLATFFGFGGAAETPVETPPQAQVETMADESQAPGGFEVQNNEGDDKKMTNDTKEEVASGGEAEASPLPPAAEPNNPNLETMLVAGGCFWCVEADLEKVPGVISAVSGYAGGTTQNPTYSNYAAGGHREVVEVTFDPQKVSYEDILIEVMKHTDPTDDDGTFHDRGDQYSSAFYFNSPEQKAIIDNLISEVDKNGPYDKPLAIDVEPLPTFWPAEDYHQDYYKGLLSQLKYKYYRNASGRDDFIKKYWGTNTGTDLPWRDKSANNNQTYMWTNYQKPSADVVKGELDDLAYKVTQEEGTEKAGSSPLDKNYEPGIYVDILSGEPLYSSKDKFDSGTGWPSFVRPITPTAVTEHEDKKLFSTRTEIRSAIADNHLGHVFNDGPKDSTGLRYCMNGAALRFIPKDQMEAEGYADFLKYI